MSRKRYTIAFVAMVGLMAAYAHHRDLFGSHEKSKERRGAVRVLRGELDSLREEEQRRTATVQYLETDDVEMEAVIRKNKNRVREGETIYRVELPPEVQPAGPGASQGTVE